ncbi:Lipopolysaccharide export system protein LptA [Saliniradius amylolyticus]|uniref:Lipopolysaccharide export system protein LptA n=1 Tax=Saliniradius amylolyticus TaxID=2183582 RepID=A0A2S2E5N0_9ALTE|nr:lipopolysaccharide transport periplasmic protein LptA [Saliniradius amylolyticus]AWL12961.1 Lipopolysaccharide export system protein LptA [Saliniradius amylolyticus]
MYKPNMIPSLKHNLLLCLLACGGAQATEGDFQQPIQVSSGSQFVDGKNKTSVFKDNVRIEQGSLLIQADEVEVIASEGKGKEVFIATGNPTTYSQLMEDGSRISASAQRIQYRVNGRQIALEGQAQFQQDNSMVKGDRIIFDMDAEQLLAEGSKQGEERVTTVFQPEEKAAGNDNQNQKEPQEP